ncbi:MAG: adenosylcobalamin-dependent ribonucleoside-diphosphate reductase [bacterium]|nr:adenosylcobalamin-dependent ribonucleoside-diphosphate reductase [bacterium]
MEVQTKESMKVNQASIIEENLGLSQNSLRVLEKRYLARDEEGKVIETPRSMMQRVAEALAKVELRYGATAEEAKKYQEQFYQVMTKWEFVPGGRTLTNAGASTRLIASCIVLHMDDSMEGIFGTLKEASLLQQAGSGLGFPWHLLRPAGTLTKKSRGMASGPVSFLMAYDRAFGVIKQQGRHGANMAVMRVDHPDILEFIECKRQEGNLVNFNISVGLTDEFMRAVKDDSKEPWMCQWQEKKMKPHLIKRNNRGAFVSAEDVTITARELMDKIVDAAWSNGEPGVLFPDTANRCNFLPAFGRLEATNPCGEQWLQANDVCNLGSINLGSFVKDKKIDKEKLTRVARVATRMLDNVIDLMDFPVEKVNVTSKANRRIGLGIMGFADMLYQMGLPYNSQAGRDTAEETMSLINTVVHDESENLAKVRGVFSNWEKSVWGPQDRNRLQRNAACTTVAPTGSISMVVECSSGVEPFFALAYRKENIMGGDSLSYINPYLENTLRARGLLTDELMEDVVKTGTIMHRADLPEDVRQVFVGAMDISADDHIRMQATFQKYVDNSISKTVNFPQSATKEDVYSGYLLAWEMGCKGCTVYRDGSRHEQVLNLNKKEEKKAEVSSDYGMHVLEPRPRPEVLRGTTYKMKTAYGNLYITVNEDEHGPFEVFSQMGKAGGFFAANLEAICRLVSLALRSGVHIDSVIRQLKGIRDPQPIWHKGEMILSLPDAIGQILEKHMKQSQGKLALEWRGDNKELSAPARVILDTGNGDAMDLGFAPACPDCGSMLQFQDGCMKCGVCGFSRCG